MMRTRLRDDKNVYCTVLWGATTDFTQDTFEYGGVFVTTTATPSTPR